MIKNRDKYRVLNLLYYVTPDWQQEYGGKLELWDGLQQPCRTIHSKFNRLVIMVTNKTSLHSVSKINYQGQRCCIHTSVPLNQQMIVNIFMLLLLEGDQKKR